MSEVNLRAARVDLGRARAVQRMNELGLFAAPPMKRRRKTMQSEAPAKPRIPPIKRGRWMRISHKRKARDWYDIKGALIGHDDARCLVAAGAATTAIIPADDGGWILLFRMLKPSRLTNMPSNAAGVGHV